MPNKKLKLGIGIFLVLLIVSACGKKEEKGQILTSPYSRREFMMGTVINIKVYNEGKESAIDAAYHRIEELDRKITVSEKGSEVDAINEAAGKEPVKVSDDVYYLIQEGLTYSASSDGSFDSTIGPLTSLWHIGFDDAKKPTQAEINQVLPLIDYQKVTMDDENKTVFLQEAGMELDLGSIAKGYIADEVAKVLEDEGVTKAIVDLGGNLYMVGTNTKDKDWSVGIQDPFLTRGEIIGTIPESNRSIVTSGIYERFVEVDGVKYHHLLDPKTGYPFTNDIVGVSIVSNKSIDGDALSTATFSKGIKGGMAYIEQFEDVEAIFVSVDKEVYITSGLKDKFKLTNDNFVLKDIKDLK
ncbi:FAD:protein FMN transferase [Isobaculum melis]|uniref:FAD:protein FMN transferase n=1 Tax=Isobaculum melis TaxID=142588 RepID=A0A1H9SGB1_9LACT|nr:FAD:protein FMN transferase [Isobaculum melis]SER84066.1 thiamine biosynthesis lipoprotein [Isobaculum melis]